MKILKRYMEGVAKVLLFALPLFALSSCEGDQAIPPVPNPASSELDAPLGEDGEPIIGKGTPESPMRVWQVRLGTLPEGMTETWMTGFIVGWVDSSVGQILNESTAVFSAPASVKSNILLADFAPEEFAKKFAAQYRIVLPGSEYDGKTLLITEIRQLQTDGRLPADLLTSEVTGPAQELLRADTRYDRCVAVQLVYDTTPRPVLNLGDNPGVLGRQVSIYGETGIKYFSVFGMKFTSEYEWGDQGHEVAPKIPGVFQLTSEFVPDKLYLIANGANIVKQVIPNDQGRQWMYTSEATVSNNMISLASIVNSFFFEQTEEGIRIRQNDGTYFLIDATDPAMHVTDDPTLPGCYFDVVPTDDGRFSIVSKLNGKIFTWSADYSSFNIYAPAEGAIVPQLYVRIDK